MQHSGAAISGLGPTVWGPPPGLAEARLHLYLSREFDRGEAQNARRRRQGAIANPVAPDAHHSVALDRAGAVADHGASVRIAAALELVRRIWRRLGGRAA